MDATPPDHDIERIAQVRHHDPFRVLGRHCVTSAGRQEGAQQMK
jgi:hypothetical protein